MHQPERGVVVMASMMPQHQLVFRCKPGATVRVAVSQAEKGTSEAEAFIRRVNGPASINHNSPTRWMANPRYAFLRRARALSISPKCIRSPMP